MPCEMSIVHDASKHLWVEPFRTKVTSLAIVTAPAVRISHVLLRLCVIVPRAGLSMYLRFRRST
jgi:hypothetical protein